MERILGPWYPVRVQRLLLAGILLVAAGLRLRALDLEPWFDEIRTHVFVSGHSFGDLAGIYESQNHHVLYSLLAKLCLLWLGDSPFALRLPAVAFGLLGIGAVYALGRRVASDREGLLAAALLAVSYHHVWFSQNARGYTALAFFALAATLLLLRVLEDGRRRDAIGYAVVAALGTYTHLTMACVVASHLAVTVAVSLGGAWHARPPRRTALALAFGGFAALVLAAYAPMLPQLWAVSATEGRSGVVADWHHPAWLARELEVGIGKAFGPLSLGALALALTAAGLWRLGRRSPLVPALFVLPLLAMAALLAVSGHHLWPRFFFFAIGFGAVALASGIFAAAAGATAWLPVRLRPHPALGWVLALGLIGTAASAVPAAWAPKQRLHEAIDLLRSERRQGDVVAAVGSTGPLLREYYGVDWVPVESATELEALRASSGRTWLVHTFPRGFSARHQDVARLLESEFTLVRRLEGTLHEGTVFVWREGRDVRTARVAGDAAREGRR